MKDFSTEIETKRESGHKFHENFTILKLKRGEKRIPTKMIFHCIRNYNSVVSCSSCM